MSCKHPIREGLGYSDNFEIVGSHSTDAWGRCKTCGAWWWSVIDEGKFQYEAEWLIPTDLAEAALVRHDPDAVAQLFVSHDLPHGPVWDAANARIEIFRALTPNQADDLRVRALERAGAKGKWEEVIRTLALDAKGQIDGSPIAFEVDLRVPGARFREHHEVGDALVLLTDRPELLRLERAGLVQLPLGAVPNVLAHAPDRILLGVAPGIVVLDAAGNATSWPIQGEYGIEPLDDGWWLFVPKTNELERFIEFHAPDGRPKVKFRRRFAKDSAWMPLPRRFGGGWIVSDLIDDDGKPQALTLFDADFKMLAASEGIDGPRQVTPIDESSFWASADDTMQRWVRRGRALDRAQQFESRASLVVGDVLITDTASGEVIGRGLDGRFRWQWKRATDGATYGVEATNGVLLYDNTRAHVLGKDGVVRADFAVDGADVLVGKQGTVYVKTGAELWIVEEGARAIVVGTGTELEATAGDCAILRRADGTWLLVSTAGILGTFEAPEASFGLFGTRGLWLCEGDRIRAIFPR